MKAALRGIGGGISAAAVIAGSIVAVAAIVWFIWWLGVFSSGRVGAGNVVKDQNSSQNREYWSAKYNADLQNLTADQSDLIGLREYANAPGATQQDKQNYEGARLNCIQDAATYNQDTANVLGRDLIPAGLPTSVTASTYCGS